MKRPTSKKTRGGWLLLEVILAISIFSLAAVGLSLALRQTAQLSIHARDATRVARLLDTALRNVANTPGISRATYEFPVEELQTSIIVKVEELDIKNRDDVQLSNLYEIVATISWDEDGQTRTMSAKTWKNSPT